LKAATIAWPELAVCESVSTATGSIGCFVDRSLMDGVCKSRTGFQHFVRIQVAEAGEVAVVARQSGFGQHKHRAGVHCR